MVPPATLLLPTVQPTVVLRMDHPTDLPTVHLIPVLHLRIHGVRVVTVLTVSTAVAPLATLFPLGRRMDHLILDPRIVLGRRTALLVVILDAIVIVTAPLVNVVRVGSVRVVVVVVADPITERQETALLTPIAHGYTVLVQAEIAVSREEVTVDLATVASDPAVVVILTATKIGNAILMVNAGNTVVVLIAIVPQAHSVEIVEGIVHNIAKISNDVYR